MFRSTYRQGDFAAFRDLFGQDSEEIQDARVALDIVAKGRDDGWKDVFPSCHLDCEYRQAHT